MSSLSKTKMNPDTLFLLRRAAVFRTLAMAFIYPANTHRRMIVKQLENAETEGLNATGDRWLLREIKRLKQAWQHADDDELRTEYARLFLGNGPCSLHETAYGDGRRIAGRPAELADISGFYTAFGLQPSATDLDLPDHLCSELEFYSLMLIKLAYAGHSAGGGWNQKKDITQRALKKFLGEHLGRWNNALVREIDTHSAASPYRETAQALETMVKIELKRNGVRPSPVDGRLPHDFMQDENFICPQESATGNTASLRQVS